MGCILYIPHFHMMNFCDLQNRGRGGKTTSGNRQVWSSPSPRGQWRMGKWRRLIAKSSVVPQWPSRLRDRWWWWYTLKHRVAFHFHIITVHCAHASIPLYCEHGPLSTRICHLPLKLIFRTLKITNSIYSNHSQAEKSLHINHNITFTKMKYKLELLTFL